MVRPIRKLRRPAVTLLAAFALGSGEVAHAASVLSTAFIVVTPPGEYIRCIVSNVSAKETTVERIDTVLATGSATNVSGALTLAPGESRTGFIAYSSARCVFTVKSKRAVRAYACGANFGASLCLTESEAR